MPDNDLWPEEPNDDSFGMESDPDEPSDEDDLDDDQSETVPCPACGVEIYEDAFQCPACGYYLASQSSSPWSGRSIWWILLGLLGTGALIYALTMPR